MNDGINFNELNGILPKFLEGKLSFKGNFIVIE